MKKTILTAILGLAVFSAGVEEAAAKKNEAVAEKNAVRAHHKKTHGGKSFKGIYLSLGLGGSFLKHKSSLKEPVTDGLGDRFTLADRLTLNRFFGTVALGGGWTFCKRFYLGGEGLIDFAKSCSDVLVSDKDSVESDLKIKTRGITPGLALRLGYVRKGWMFYVKPAVSFPRVKAEGFTQGKEWDTSKAGYSVALGIDKSFSKKFSARFEGEYSFGSNNKKIDLTDAGQENWLKIKFNRGFNIRALCSYNVIR
ncbi:MAG: hypothetical protein LBO73_03285 [Holosporaceae bacterium]|jgi:opacity protein-like surface antigen|nr:hypothetical protein [Holosporaceae bacterium]